MSCELCHGRGVVTMTVPMFYDGGWFPDYMEVPCPGCRPVEELYEPPDDAPELDILPAFERVYQYG